MKKLFGTDGIRGKANSDPMTSEMALQIGRAVVQIMKKKGHRQRVIIGKDTRLSGYLLESALASGISSMGADVILVGPMPTPGIAFITNNMDADCGIVISASHNPFNDNGIKIFSKEGIKLSDAQENEIEELIFSKKLSKLVSPSHEVGRAFRENDAYGRYIVFLRHTFPKDMNLEGMRIVLDCANGATYKIAPTLFREMRAEVISLGVNPDGKNINLDCGALYPELLAERVLQEKADIGIAFDGDGDRMISVDEKGSIVKGDKVLAICAKNMKEEGRLKNNLVVSTVMSNIGLSHALRKMRIEHIKSKVGDRYVLEDMLKNGAVLGGEESGHIIFLEHHTTGDGIITALQVLAVMQKEKKTLSQLSRVMKTYPQVLMNVDVEREPRLNGIPAIVKVIQKVEKELGSRGRVLVRYSGTQPVCRVMVEGPTRKETERLAMKISSVVKEKLG